MKLVLRFALGLVAAGSIALVAPAVATADEEPAINIDKMLQTGQPGYYEPGDSITYLYEVTGNERFINVAVIDDRCATVQPVLGGGPGGAYNIGDTIAPFGALNGLAGEKWVYTCTMTAPAWVNPGASFTNKATVTAISPPPPGWEIYQGITWTADDTFTLKAVVLRKAVYTFWNYNDGIPDAGSANVNFTVDVKNGGVVKGTETISVNDPLYMWMGPGTWQLKEQAPPAGYRVFDGRDTWNVDLADGWRDNTFINGADFDLAITKASASPYAAVGGTIIYEYEVTNTGPGAVTPVVSDNKCSPVTYASGDTNTDGKIQATETWKFTCSMILTPATFNAAHNTAPYELKNTATVVADEADDLLPVCGGCEVFGGDINVANNTAELKLKPAVLRKLVVLYWDYVNYVAAPGTGDVQFNVDLIYKGALTDTLTVSKNAPLMLMLAPGTWRFEEATPPTGFTVLRGTWNIGTLPSTARLDNTFFNRAPFDLAIEKSGPEWAHGGSTLTYAYSVTNTGTGVVTPVVTDSRCSPVTYIGGDTVADGKIQSTETWTYGCTYTPSWAGAFPDPLTNTATVVDAEKPTGPPWNLGLLMGGDTCSANNTDTYTLYPFVLRKEVGLYNDGAYPNFGAFSDNTSFSVKMYKGSAYKTAFSISESSPKYLWLSAGTWKFTEVNLPRGYFAFYPGATITFVTGTYPDWTHLNVTWSGCSHGYWKNHTPWPGSYLPTTMIKGVFSAWGTGTETLGDALAFPGGSGTTGAKQILLRQAVAALLNEAQYGTAFGPYTSVANLVSAVNTALGGNRGAMLTLAGTLDYWNNGICR